MATSLERGDGERFSIRAIALSDIFADRATLISSLSDSVK